MNNNHIGAFVFTALFALSVTLPAEAATRAELEAHIALLKTQLATLQGGASSLGAFTANLTIGSTGSEVTRLQNWLIANGYAIPAGATGYFGAQTATALGAYQAAHDIVPAVGYFGPTTRATVNASLVVTPDPEVPTDDDESEDEASDDDRANAQDARDAIGDLEDAIEEADEDIDNDEDEAHDLLDEAREKIDGAEDSFDDRDYDEAIDLADEGMDLVEDALDEAGLGDNDDDEGDGRVISATADTTSVDGADNDIATFTLKLELKAFGADMFIPRDASDAFTYRIENANNGSTVTGGSRSETLSSSADVEGDYFVLREDDKETFTFRVTFNPDPSDEGADFRFQLLTVEYADDEAPPTATWSTHADSEFETDPTYLAD